MSASRDLAMKAKAWPFQEARKLLKRVERKMPEKGYVVFETGYGPSGLPHLGTFGEVARTTMVMHAFQQISAVPTKLICFSDDMDGFRKVPTNLPNQEMLTEHLGQPLSRVPDPFGTHDSLGAHNNARLVAFLDQFGFDYEFYSSTTCYASGQFNATLLKILQNYDKVINVILPTLGEERRQTYSPFLPICPKSGNVLQVALTGMDVDKGTISFIDSEGDEATVPVTDGHVKLQWKVDWAMRWDALDVDYEMAGKDLADSVKLSGAIRRILGGQPPEGFIYEMFLDDKGEKISKSKGNGLSIEEWLSYGSPESLSLYMFQKPTTAKRLHFDVIPKAVDEYYNFVRAYHEQDDATRLSNPAYHIHSGNVPVIDMPVTFALLLNLVGAANTNDKDVLWGFVSRYVEGSDAQSHPEIDRMMGYAIQYYEDFVAPTKSYRLATADEQKAFADLLEKLNALPDDADGDTVQTQVYAVGKENGYENLRDWFKACYEVLLGQPQGPRMGNFFALYGVPSSREMVAKAARGELAG